jgi:hypothetical protein
MRLARGIACVDARDGGDGAAEPDCDADASDAVALAAPAGVGLVAGDGSTGDGWSAEPCSDAAE